MKRLAVLSVMFAVAGKVPAAVAQDFTTAQILAKLDEKAKVFTSLQASLKNIEYNFGVLTAGQSGKLTISKAKDTPRILMDIAEPRKTLALIDKGKAILYYPDDNTYRERKVDEQGDALQFLLIGFGASSEQIGKGYKAEAKSREMLGGVNAVVLELTPIAESTKNYPLKLWLVPQTWTPVQTRIGKTKTYNDYKYSNVQLNRAVSDSIFDLKMKAGAKKQ
jgi:outer membrane lipoprotein-sorting protein